MKSSVAMPSSKRTMLPQWNILKSMRGTVLTFTQSLMCFNFVITIFISSIKGHLVRECLDYYGFVMLVYRFKFANIVFHYFSITLGKWYFH